MTPSVAGIRRLRRDLVLIALPPRDWAHRGALLVAPKDAFDHDRAGVTLQVGAAVTAVRPLDRVIFDAFAAEAVTVNGRECVLVPETALDAVLE